MLPTTNVNLSIPQVLMELNTQEMMMFRTAPSAKEVLEKAKLFISQAEEYLNKPNVENIHKESEDSTLIINGDNQFMAWHKLLHARNLLNLACTKQQQNLKDEYKEVNMPLEVRI